MNRTHGRARPCCIKPVSGCADDEEFGSKASSAGVPFRGFSTAAAALDDAEVGTPSPFGSAMAQRMASRWALVYLTELKQKA